jgi:hypothetical protein
MPKFKLTIIKIEDSQSTDSSVPSATEVIYSYEFPDEAAARKLIHDSTKPVRTYKPRAPKAAK